MRVHFPPEINREMDFLQQYLVYSESGYHIKDDAPDDIKKRYEKLRREVHKIMTQP